MRLRSKLVAIVLVCGTVILGGHIPAPWARSVGSVPAGCHNHGQPSRTPVSHQCCAVGHSPSVVQTDQRLNGFNDFSSPVVAEAHSNERPYRRSLLITASLTSSSPPGTAPLRL